MNGVGTGVVIVDNGTILTNLHVVAGAKRIAVTFPDGTESEADVIGAQPENDLAVIRAKKIARRPAGRDARLDRSPEAGRRGGRGRLPVRHRPVGSRRRRFGARPRVPFAAKASAC